MTFSNIQLDFLKQDVHKWFPELEPYVKITLVGKNSHNLKFSFLPTKQFLA